MPTLTREELCALVWSEPIQKIAPRYGLSDRGFGKLFEAGRRLDGWTCQVLENATHVAATILEIERVTGRLGAAAPGRADGRLR